MTETNDQALRSLPLEARHVELGGQLVPFAGWHMPIQYTGIVAEHEAVRTNVGLFDVSHMGEVFVEGGDPATEGAATRWLSRLIAHDPAGLELNQALYTVMCNEQGGVVDDLIVYRLAPDVYLLCINAARIDADVAHMRATLPDDDTISFHHVSDEWAQLAIQGPNAAALMDGLLATPTDTLGKFHIRNDTVAGVELLIARTGYTGEDGFELYIPIESSVQVFDAIITHGASFDLAMCGLGARDTLRLEAKMLLYGQDMDDQTSPLEAGLNWVIRWEKPEPFIGQAALEAQKAAGIPRRLRCFTLEGRGVMRPGYTLWHEDRQVGVITSGTHSPTLGTSIALGYLDADALKSRPLEVQIRKRRLPVTVSTKPFYKAP